MFKMQAGLPLRRSRGIDSTVQRKRQDELVSNKNKGAA